MIYCVEDDTGIRELITYTLRSTGYDAEGFEDGRTFFEKLNQQLPELILLDIMLPDEDGISILKKLKASPRTADIPVIMATAKGTEYDKVVGLDMGADDYLTKPFGMMEMISRVKAVLRRYYGKNGMKEKELVLGTLRINTAEHNVYVNNERIELTLKEFEILRLMTEHPGQVFTRDRLLSEIWGYDFNGETRTVDVHVRSLRQKLGACGEYIGTVRGVGYRMEVRV